jgi:hypothetical protein
MDSRSFGTLTRQERATPAGPGSVFFGRGEHTAAVHCTKVEAFEITGRLRY